ATGVGRRLRRVRSACLAAGRVRSCVVISHNPTDRSVYLVSTLDRPVCYRQGMQAHTKPSARDRLLAAADELFYAEGVNSVGIDRVIEHAGVAKATLYSAFGSKDGLIRAYLMNRHYLRVERIMRHVDKKIDPREKLLAVFDSLAELFATVNWRGCPFLAAP